MRITVFGATGAVGSRVVQEALTRHHEVTAVGRNLDRLTALAQGLGEVDGARRTNRRLLLPIRPEW